ncbi:MAG: mucoidy inhibitor MuiA family protein [Bacteroidota bacterium]
MNQLDTHITAVTVYPDRALVSRVGSLKLPTGRQKLSLPGLPGSMLTDSVQVEGRGSGSILDVKVVSQPQAQNAHPAIQKLEEQLLGMQEQIMLLDKKKARLEGEKSFIEGMARRLTAEGQEGEAELSLDKWREMLGFYAAESERIDLAIHRLEQEHRRHHKIIQQIQQQIRDIRGRNQQQLWDLELEIDVAEEGDMHFKADYQVMGPSWEPRYEIRAFPQEGEVGIRYQALVRQNTGEDWGNVALRISTARPKIGGNPPELKPMLVDRVRPPKPKVAAAPMKKSTVRASRSAGLEMAKEMSWGGAELEEAAPVMESPEAKVESESNSVRFHIDGASNVPPDNNQHQLNIMQTRIKADITYLAVPAKSPLVYLIAKMRNETDYPFLEGRAMIFMEQHFVGKARIKYVATGAEFDAPLGTDQDVSTERKSIEAFASSEGFIGKKRRNLFSWELSLTNQKAFPIKVRVQDQFPKSVLEEVKVELLEPKPRSGQPVIDKHNIICWEEKVQPGQKWQAKLTYAVVAQEGLRWEMRY